MSLICPVVNIFYNLRQKLFIIDANSSSQPFTVTKSSSLNGSAMVAGGSIIIPIDIRVLDTIISMSRNGM